MDVITATVDARGQSCPGPLVALHKALKDADRGTCSSSSRPTRVRSPTSRPGRSSRVTSSLDASETSGVYRYVIRKV